MPPADAASGRSLCGAIDIAALERDRDQLWAEARSRFRAGDPWWLESPELEKLAAEEQADRYQGDAWEELIRAFVEKASQYSGSSYRDVTLDCRASYETVTDVSVAEILEHVLLIEKGRWTQRDQNRVARCLTSMGFRQYRARRGSDRERRYRRKPLDENQPRSSEGPGSSDLGPGKVRV